MQESHSIIILEKPKHQEIKSQTIYNSKSEVYEHTFHISVNTTNNSAWNTLVMLAMDIVEEDKRIKN